MNGLKIVLSLGYQEILTLKMPPICNCVEKVNPENHLFYTREIWMFCFLKIAMHVFQKTAVHDFYSVG